MKQKAVKIIMFLIMAISMPLLFVGCFNQKQRLAKPQVIISEANNEIIARCTTIENANGYCFEVNNIPFISTTPELNLSNIMLEYKTYIIKVYALGSGDYTNSKISNIVQYNKERKFATPLLNISETMLSWSAIEDAEVYMLKVNNTEPIEITTTQVDIKQNATILNLIEVNKNNTFEVKVKATAESKESEYSNTVNYSETTQLTSANNLNIEKNNSNFILTWQSIYETMNYKVYLFDTEIAQTTQKQLDVTQYLTQAKDYVFAVECISDSELVENSPKSENYVYKNIIQLQAPTITNVYVDDENNVIAEWNKTENAISYEVTINQTHTLQVFAEKHVIKFEQAKEYAQEEITFSIKALGYNNFSDSEASAEINFNPYTTLSLPQNIKIENINNTAFLSFKAVENAKTYIIWVNETEFETEETYLDLSNVIQETKIYQLKIKCKAYDFYKESEYTSPISYKHTNILSVPTNVSGSIINDILTIDWDSQSTAISYSVNIVFESASTVIITENNYYEYPLYSGGEYSYSVKAVGDNNYYFDSEYSAVQKVKLIKQVSAPSNFEYEKDSSYLSLSWSKVPNVKYYQLTYDGTTINVIGESIRIALSEFSKGTYIFELKAIAIDSEYYINSTISSLTYEHGNSVNTGELFYVNKNYYDFYIESYEELISLIDFAYQFNKENVSFYANFNYSQDLTSENYYSAYASSISNYNKVDSTIRNEVISAIISVGAQEDMSLVSVAQEDTKITLTLSYTNNIISKTVNATATPIDKQFTAYTAGSKTSLYCETLTTLPEANNINTTKQMLYVLAEGKKPQFETTVKGVEVADYYNKFVQILNSNISKSATTYQKVLAIYDYLMANVTYDFACETYVTNNNVNYNQYYSYNIEGVAKNFKATSVGLAKTFALMCLMEGIEATYNIAKDNNVIVGYCTVKVNNSWYAVDFYKSILKSGEITGTTSQYFTHYYFLNNSSSLSYISSTTESWPQKQSATANTNYFENFDTNTGNCKLVASDIDSITEIVTYCAYNNKYALEVQLGMSMSTFKTYISMAKTFGYMTDCKYFSNNDKTVFVKITP